MISRPGGRKTWIERGHLVKEGMLKPPRVFVLENSTVVGVAWYNRLRVLLGKKGESGTGPLPLDPKSYGYPG